MEVGSEAEQLYIPSVCLSFSSESCFQKTGSSEDTWLDNGTMEELHLQESNLIFSRRWFCPVTEGQMKASLDQW